MSMFRKGDRVQMKAEVRSQFPGRRSYTGTIDREPTQDRSVCVLIDGGQAGCYWHVSFWEKIEAATPTGEQ
jgi:hypothetical protein